MKPGRARKAFPAAPRPSEFHSKRQPEQPAGLLQGNRIARADPVKGEHLKMAAGALLKRASASD